MLRPSFRRSYAQLIPISKLMQDLAVFASEIQLGGVLQQGAPNYALLYRATSTIESFLRATFSPDGPFKDSQETENIDRRLLPQDLNSQIDPVPFDLSAYTDLWGFEYDFWQNLGAHPSLLASYD